MAEKIIKTQIGLRRDTEENFDLVKETLKPIKGEVCLIDTSNGLNIKVGDGENTFANLPSYTLGQARHTYDEEEECLIIE